MENPLEKSDVDISKATHGAVDLATISPSHCGDDERGVENLATCGLLFGTDYEKGKRVRGIWGLYGNLSSG